MKRPALVRGKTAPLEDLRGLTKKRSQEAVTLTNEAVRYELLAEMFDRVGDRHSALLERNDAKRRSP